MSDLKPCPFCASVNLREVDMLLATDEGEEQIDVIECLAALFWIAMTFAQAVNFWE